MAFEVLTDAGRTVDFTVPLYEADGTTAVVLSSGDVVRCKVGRAGTATLDIDSVAATANGSLVTIDTLSPASVTIRFAQGDTSSLRGVYDVEVGMVDDSETAPADAFKPAEQGSLAVRYTMDGDVGLT